MNTVPPVPPVPPPPLDEPLPFRRLIDKAGALTRQHFKTLFLPIALPLVVMQVVMAAIQVANLPRMGELMVDLSAGDFAAVLPMLRTSCLTGLVVAAMFSLVNTAALSGTANAAAGRPITLASHWGHALKPRVLATGLLFGFLVGFGYLFLILPGIILGTLWGFAVTVTVEDRLHGFAALARSYRLSGYNPQGTLTSSPRFKLFVLVIVGWVLSIAASLALQAPLQILQQIMTTRDAISAPEEMFASDWFWLAVPNAALGALGGSAVLLYLSFGVSLLYRDVRQRREGSDLKAELDALDVPRLATGMDEP